VGVARTARADGALIELEFRANAFLQHMVRNLVGLLAAIGRGETVDPPSRHALEKTLPGCR